MNAAFLHRPLYGGPFGRDGRFALATLPCVLNGLHAVRHLVIDPTTGSVLSVADTKLAALASARNVLRASEQLTRAEAMQRQQAVDQLTLWPPEALQPPAIRDRKRPVSRRRRDIFEKCGGACHYCASSLRLAGPWHVEHMLPRSLGGLDEIGNLVAACAPCNLAKGDRTALEYVASLTA